MKPLTMALALISGALWVWLLLPRRRIAEPLIDETDRMGDYGAYPVSRTNTYVH